MTGQLLSLANGLYREAKHDAKIDLEGQGPEDSVATGAVTFKHRTLWAIVQTNWNVERR